MIYKFLWNFRLWVQGITMAIMYPFVILWIYLIDKPIEWAKEFEQDRIKKASEK